MNNTSNSTWWRWILIFPACVVGSILGALAMGVIQWLGMKFTGGYSEDGWYFRYILPVITSATFGYLWVEITCQVAPRAKKISAIVTTTVLLTTLILATIFSLTNVNHSLGEKIQSVLGGVAMAITAIITILEYKE